MHLYEKVSLSNQKFFTDLGMFALIRQRFCGFAIKPGRLRAFAQEIALVRNAVGASAHALENRFRGKANAHRLAQNGN